MNVKLTRIWRIVLVLILGFVFLPVCFFITSAMGAETSNANIKWANLFMGLFGGLALFLAGLDQLSEGLKKAAGNSLKTLLSKMTTNRFMGAATGAFITAILNSSSVTTVLVVGFITAGVMTLSQSVGVIMGANIGSTMTAQLLAFNISSYALWPVAIGFLMTFTGKRQNVKHIGMMLMGLGLVFYGMGLMSEAMKPLRTYEPFLEFLKSMERPLLGILAGALFTGLVQSSAATVGIAIAMASEGLLSLEGGIALALGANIGTCVTALLAALGKPIEAVRAATVHVLFNIVGVLVWLPFIGQLASLAVIVSSGTSEMENIPRQLANANTMFNVINTICFIGFAGWFAKFATRLWPDRDEKTGILISPKYLDESAVTVPSIALELVRQEFGRMGDITTNMLTELPKAILNRDQEHIDEIAKLDDKVDILEAAIFSYLGKVRQQALTEEESKIHQDLMSATVNLETLSDVIETDLARLTKSFVSKERQVRESTSEIFHELYDTVSQTVELAIKSIRDNDQHAAADVVSKRQVVNELADNLLGRMSQSINTELVLELETARIEISFIDKLRRTYSLARRIAQIVLPSEVLEGR